eukprot:CAMPEP_0201583586 /NCGR_PEP_ID=MMETSP0190_2-20130828/100151_1 /ASSEMBLY_ACC=CAM_ASM_000263 /TAXON_ID=37353 /ORGANISM="Rosalina sp." /LENGTH=78 /DNA_ID=CAMNT_0048025737 /DNA_START=22 /DNA_END=254 /DNA_ORIENTATION=+
MLNSYVKEAKLKIALGDKIKVKLKNHNSDKSDDKDKDKKKGKKYSKEGIVSFYGCVESKGTGTYYGISFHSEIGKNDG